MALRVPISAALATSRADAVRSGLKEAGLVEGVHYALALRSAEGQLDRLPALAKELHDLDPAVFIAGGSLVGVRELVPPVPVVFTSIAIDPVERGYAASYARPAGWFTGNVLNALGGEDTIAEKRISLFKQLVPGLTRLGMLGQTSELLNQVFDKELSAGRSTSPKLGFEIFAYRLRTIDDLERAIESAMHDRIDGIYLSGEPLFISNLSRALPLIMSAGKPTVGPYPEMARSGVLMTYGADPLDGYRRAGASAAKILRGAKPGELPIEQPSKFTFAINAKTAKQLGVIIPPLLEASADEVVE